MFYRNVHLEVYLVPHNKPVSVKVSDVSSLVSCRMFGFVARRSGALGNVCHLFAELDPEQPATAIVNFINKVMLGPQQLRK